MFNYQRLRSDKDYFNQIKKRTKIINLIREFFNRMDFLEVDTPLVVKLPGMEPYLDPFKTKVIDIYGKEYSSYLITSPEYAMKKLLVGGMDRIYQICKCFRNMEDWKDNHNPEFTMIEWYRAHADYTDIIKDTIDLFKFICNNLNNSFQFTYQGKIIDLEKSEIITMEQALKQYADIKLQDINDINMLRMKVIEKGYSAKNSDTYEDLFYKIFLNEIEPNLGKGTLTVLKDFPIQLASLSKIKKDRIDIAERFECYIEGIELCNGFSELTDPAEQKRRLLEEKELRKKLGKEDYNIDETFINALEQGMPESGGVALGVDRLVMLFTDSKDIRDILLFPMGDMF